MLPSSAGTMIEEDEVAGEERLRCGVEDRQVVVGMRGRPGAKLERSSAEVEAHAASSTSSVGDDDRDLSRERCPEQIAVRREIVRAACRERRRQALRADEGDVRRLESGVAEDMVGMHVRVDDVADRLVGHRLDRGEQCARPPRRFRRVSITATAFSPTTKPILAMAPSILGGDQRNFAGMHEDARRDLRDRQGGIAPAGRIR